MNTSNGKAPGLAVRSADAFQAFRDGNPRGMSELVEQVTPLLWHIARQQGLTRTTAEDAVQVAWLKLVEHSSTIQDPHAVLKWLVTTTRREAWRLARASRREDPLDEEAGNPKGLSDVSTGADELFLAAARDATVWSHFHALSEKCRNILRAVAFAERPDYAAISEALGMPVGSIGPTRGRCLAKLRASILADPAWEGAR